MRYAPIQKQLLDALADRQPATLTDLAARTGLTPKQLSNACSNAVKAGHIVRVAPMTVALPPNGHERPLDRHLSASNGNALAIAPQPAPAPLNGHHVDDQLDRGVAALVELVCPDGLPVLTCTRCSMVRRDEIDPRVGDVFARSYEQPEGYARTRDEALTRSEFRLEYLKATINAAANGGRKKRAS